MIEKGDMVYYNGIKWEVAKVKGEGLSLNRKNAIALTFQEMVKPIYRNGVKVRV